MTSLLDLELRRISAGGRGAMFNRRASSGKPLKPTNRSIKSRKTHAVCTEEKAATAFCTIKNHIPKNAISEALQTARRQPNGSTSPPPVNAENAGNIVCRSLMTKAGHRFKIPGNRTTGCTCPHITCASSNPIGACRNTNGGTTIELA